MKPEDIARGQVLAKPGSIMAYAQFECQIYMSYQDEGGRSSPFHKDYRPEFCFRTAEVRGTIELSEGVDMVWPGDNVQRAVRLEKRVELNKGQRFSIREGGKTVGAGVVSKTIA